MAEALIWSNEHGAWWAPGKRGYTRVIEAAGRWRIEDAALIVHKATVGGQITVTRKGPRGERLTVPPEVLVALPMPTAQVVEVEVPPLVVTVPAGPLARPHRGEEETGG